MDTTENQKKKDSHPNQKGATMVEYALLVALMSIGCMTVTSLVSFGIRAKFEDVTNALGGILG